MSTSVARQGIGIHAVDQDFFYDPPRRGVWTSLEAVNVMVAVEHPRADCGHAASLTQQCGRCLRWCCPECYAPWTALACGACRLRVRAVPEPLPVVEPQAAVPAEARCRDRIRTRRASGAHRPGENPDVRRLAARVADLERRLQELRPGP